MSKQATCSAIIAASSARPQVCLQQGWTTVKYLADPVVTNVSATMLTGISRYLFACICVFSNCFLNGYISALGCVWDRLFIEGFILDHTNKPATAIQALAVHRRSLSLVVVSAMKLCGIGLNY